MKTYNELFLETKRRLRGVSGGAHELEARLIIAFASGKTREELLNASKYYVTDAAVLKTVDDMVQRRAKGEPVAYVVGEWEFYGLPMYVSPAVLIPRIDTEVLAETAIKTLRNNSGHTRVLDLCTGSGCVGIAIAASVPDCRVVLADNSEQALAVCRANMIRNKVTRNTTAIVVDALEAPPALLGSFDLIVCNPPYIPAEDINDLDCSVREYEPVAAIDGGSDGLKFYHVIAQKWAVLLNRGGHVLFECGIGQADDVCEIMSDHGFTDIKTVLDTLGVKRVVSGVVKR